MEVKVEKATEVAAKQGMLAFIDKFCFLPVNFSGRLFANEPCFKLKKERYCMYFANTVWEMVKE